MASALPKLPVRVVGGSGPVLFFIHGFPDDEKMWERQAAYFGERGYRCALVTMPHYTAEPTHRCLWRSSGYDFDELADMLAMAIRSVSPQDPVNLVVHDWGSVYGFFTYAKYPSLVQRIVSLDVGFYPGLCMGPTSFWAAGRLIFFGSVYQYMLIFIWILHFVPIIGQPLAGKLFSGWARHGKKFLVDQGCHWPSDPASLKALPGMCYSYFYLHFRFWLSFFGLRKHPGQDLLEQTFPECPMLYAFGTLKPFMFHTEAWLESMHARPACEVHAIEGAFHWLNWDKPDLVNELISKFLERR